MRTDKSIVVGLAVLTGVLVVTAIAMGGMMGGGMGPGMMYGYGTSTFAGGWAPGIAMGLGVLMMVAFWGVVILGIAFLARAFTGRPQTGTHPEPDALALIQRRYAAGEIDDQTYQRMRRELTGEAYPRAVERAS